MKQFLHISSFLGSNNYGNLFFKIILHSAFCRNSLSSQAVVDFVSERIDKKSLEQISEEVVFGFVFFY